MIALISFETEIGDLQNTEIEVKKKKRFVAYEKRNKVALPLDCIPWLRHLNRLCLHALGPLSLPSVLSWNTPHPL